MRAEFTAREAKRTGSGAAIRDFRIAFRAGSKRQRPPQFQPVQGTPTPKLGHPYHRAGDRTPQGAQPAVTFLPCRTRTRNYNSRLP